MLKYYSFFSEKILFAEKMFFLKSKNVYGSFFFKKTLLIFFDKNNTTKKFLMYLAILKILFGSNGFLIKGKMVNKKRNILVGVKLTFNKNKLFLFNSFLILNIFPLIDLKDTFSFKHLEDHFNLVFDSSFFLKRANFLFHYFKGIWNFQILFCCKKVKKKSLFFRLFKFPVVL